MTDDTNDVEVAQLCEFGDGDGYMYVPVNHEPAWRWGYVTAVDDIVVHTDLSQFTARQLENWRCKLRAWAELKPGEEGLTFPPRPGSKMRHRYWTRVHRVWVLPEKNVTIYRDGHFHEWNGQEWIDVGTDSGGREVSSI